MTNPMPMLRESAFAELLSGGAILSSAEFQRRMGWSADDVTRAELERRIFSLESGSVRAYPAFYTDQTYAREQLEAITIALADLPGGSKWIFFTLPKGSLATPGGPTEDEREEGNARTPLEALSHGDFEAVMVAAAGYYER